MATPDQVAGFTSSWAPYAVSVGQQLGVDPNIILAQWGMESGWGTNSGSRNYNVAGITRAGVPGDWASYSSQQDFADAFTGLVQRMYPGAVNSGDNLAAYTQGLAGTGRGSYFGGQSPASYASAIQGAQGAFTPIAAGDWSSWFMNGLRWLTEAPPPGQTTPLVNAPGDAKRAAEAQDWLATIGVNGAAVVAGVLLVVVVTAASLIGGRSPVQVVGRVIKGS